MMGLSCVIFGHVWEDDDTCVCGADKYAINTGYTREQIQALTRDNPRRYEDI